MVKIEVDGVVLATLQKHFPNPKKSAKRALDKYIKLLTEQLTQSVIQGRSAWMVAHDLYSISVYRQRNRGGQIGSSKVRLQKWLELNNLELFKVSVLGSNMSKQLSVVKLTAISFGARRSTKGWRVSGDQWSNPALVDIFKSQSDRGRFIMCPIVEQFISEQNLLDKYIFQTCKDGNPPFMLLPGVRTQSGKLSKAKVIAYLYQHFETQVMDVVADEVEKRGRKVLARIHDAIIIDRRL